MYSSWKVRSLNLRTAKAAVRLCQERAGVRPAGKKRGQAEAPSGRLASGGPVGTCPSAIQTPPLEVPVTNHALLLCKPRPRGKGETGKAGCSSLTGLAGAGAYIQPRGASCRRPRTARRPAREGVVGGEGRTLGKGEGSPYDPRYLQEGDGRRKNMLGGQGTSGKEGSVTLPCRLARETTRSKIHKRGDLWPGAPRDMLFLTYIHMWRSNIYVFLTRKDQNPHRSSDSWPPWENQKPWPLWVPSPAQNRGRVEGALSGCCTPAAGSTQAFSHSACQMGTYICDTAHCKPNPPVLQTGRQRPRKSGEAPRFNPGLLTLSLCSFSALNLKALSFHLGLSLLVCKREQ